MELVSLRCNRDFTSASSYGLGWYKYAIATQWYQFHTTDAWWFSLINIIGSDNVLLLGRRQAIIGSNDGISSIHTVATNSSEILSEIHNFHSRKCHWKCCLLNGSNFVKASMCSHVNTLRLRQDGRHFADDISKCIFLNENVWIPIEISLKFVPKGPIDNIPALV